MNIETINAKIDELLALVKGWSEQEGATNIERDLALQKLSQLYDLIRFDATIGNPTPAPDKQVEEQKEEVEESPKDDFTDVVNIMDDSIFDINIDSVSLIENDEQEIIEETAEEEVLEEVLEEPLAQPSQEIEKESEAETSIETEDESEVEIEVEESKEEPSEIETAKEDEEEKPLEKPKSQDNMLFDIDIVPKQSRSRRSALMSLYQNDELPTKRTPRSQTKEREDIAQSQTKVVEPTLDIVEHKEEPQVEMPKVEVTKSEEPKIEPQRIDETPRPTVADVIAPSVKTIAEQLAERHRPRPLNERVTYKSFNDLGINERYLLSRELFGDDPQRCRQVLTVLEACREYEDAMIYIAENFNWNEKSPGANVINTILENKFNI